MATVSTQAHSGHQSPTSSQTMQNIRSLEHIQASSQGGPQPVWSPNGELIYDKSHHTIFAPEVPPHARQIRPLRTPSYTPVALRITQYPPQQKLWLTRRRTSSVSTGSDDGEQPAASPRSSTDGAGNARSSSHGMDVPPTVMEEEWMFGFNMSHRVEGPPTREHWKPDSHARHCDSSRCATTFSFFERRHHCRKCGLVFCNTHTPHAVPLDELARFHTEGFRVRACDECWDDYRTWETLRCSRNNSYSDESSLQNSPPTPGEGIAFTRSRMGGKGRAMMNGKIGQGQGPGMGESVGTSVPRNWEWSTF